MTTTIPVYEYLLDRVQFENLASEYFGHVLRYSGTSEADAIAHVSFTPQKDHTGEELRGGFVRALSCFQKKRV